MTTTIPNETLRALLICTFRYALGRRSYMVASAANLVRKHHTVLTASDLRLMVSDIERALEFGHVDDECDEATWRELVAWVHSTPMVERMR